MLYNGQQIGRYKISSAIGKGGMGEVFLAEDTKLGRKVALKILPENFAQDKERLRRFEQEARAASGLNHPNILTVYEFGFEGGVHFLATELVEGETLREKIEGGEMSLIGSLNIAEQTAFALAAAHSAGIVHRDLKPENVMIRRDGIIKVLDFGLAKLLKKEGSADAEAETRALIKTNPGVVMGTASYMSPEQARGKDTDARTDIFSLGCVLYEMLTRRLPFSGETISDVIAAILKSEPLSPTHFSSEIPAELERIVLKSLAKDREERYQTAKDLSVDLRRLKRQMELGAEIERTKPPHKSAENATENATRILAPRQTSSAEYVVSEAKKHKLGFVVAAVILLLAIGGLGVWYFGNRPSNTKQIESIAVLPFENGSGNADLDYLSDGLSESVIDRLSQLPQIKVIARSSSFEYRGQNLNLREIADALGVQAIVSGRVAQRGDSYTIRVEMIDARENRNLWSESFNRKASDVLALQTDISREIADNLRVRLSGTQTQQFTSQGTKNPEAYELLLKGRFYLNRTGQENFHRAVEYLEQAVAVDPNYALAYVDLVQGYDAGGRGLDRKERQIRREAAAYKALELDPNLADAHYAVAEIKRDRWEWAEAEREYKRAIEMNPNLARAHGGYAGYLSLMRRHDEAIAETKRARELDPFSPFIETTFLNALFRARRYDEALEAARNRLELGLNIASAHRRIGDIYSMKGMYREAIAEYQEALKLSGGDSFRAEVGLGAAYAKAGMRAEAEEIIQKLKARDSEPLPNQSQTIGNDVVPTRLAVIYDALGMRNEAFAWLEKAYAERERFLPFIASEPHFDSLRPDPRFQDLLRRMGLPQ
jgi:eukaryotic-like serine/threonine-protein kinase